MCELGCVASCILSGGIMPGVFRFMFADAFHIRRLMLAAALIVRGHDESKRKSERLKVRYCARRASNAGRITLSVSTRKHFIQSIDDCIGLVR